MRETKAKEARNINDGQGITGKKVTNQLIPRPIIGCVTSCETYNFAFQQARRYVRGLLKRLNDIS